MRDPLKALLVALAASVLTLLISGGWPQAQAQERGAKWDYEVFRLDPRDYKDKLDWKEAVRLGGADGAEAIFYEHVLDSLASQGWELIQSQQRSPTVTYFYLRKPAR
ncbi:MAG: hypothetical protein JKY65_07825 [Planctomycetes bacterium]|nr:hypothetical protein [Planctomycetota bacterium]